MTTTLRALWMAVPALAVFALGPVRAARACEGDCDASGVVDITDLMIGVNVLLERAPVEQCAALDTDRDRAAEVYELVAAVRRSLQGCPYPRDGQLRLNQIQALGSHNSYHIQVDPPLFALIQAFNEGLAESIEYTHPPLPEQFDDRGIRQIELDVWADPQGGLYAHPIGLPIITGDPNSSLPELEAPGFKVLHVQDVDFRSTCPTFVACLETVKAWSDAHPLHMPIMVEVEAKDDPLIIPGFNFTVPIPIGADELDGIDAEIRSVFPPEKLITPDDVRGSRETLAEAVQNDGWPTLGASRGKLIFCLDNEGKRDPYLAGHPSLQGRVMFTPAPMNAPDSAFRKLNDPIGDFDDIQAAVAAGLIVRTRADADTVEARAGNTMPRDAALASGAQWVSTDYPVPDPNFGTGYMVEIPQGMPARCNPISAPSECAVLDIENPAHLVE